MVKCDATNVYLWEGIICRNGDEEALEILVVRFVLTYAFGPPLGTDIYGEDLKA